MKKQAFLINKLTIDFINTTQATIEKKPWHVKVTTLYNNNNNKKTNIL
jgi:hypothetical protein